MNIVLALLPGVAQDYTSNDQLFALMFSIINVICYHPSSRSPYNKSLRPRYWCSIEYSHNLNIPCKKKVNNQPSLKWTYIAQPIAENMIAHPRGRSFITSASRESRPNRGSWVQNVINTVQNLVIRKMWLCSTKRFFYSALRGCEVLK